MMAQSDSIAIEASPIELATIPSSLAGTPRPGELMLENIKDIVIEESQTSVWALGQKQKTALVDAAISSILPISL